MTKEAKVSFLFFAPAGIFMLIFLLFPVMLLIKDSFFQVDMISQDSGTFVGISNYIESITSDRFLGATTNTLIYVVVAVSAELLLGLFFAMLLNTGFKGHGFVRTILLSPLMIAPLVSGLIWKFMLNSQFGIVNQLLYDFNITSSRNAIQWLSDDRTALLSTIIADIWLTTPFMMLVLLAGLQGIPVTLYESAKIDGANKIKTFFYITLPSLLPVLVVAILIRTVDAARTFDIVWVLTQGGPANSSEVLSTYMYKTLTRYGEVGESSAMAVLFIILLLLLSSYFLISMFKANKK
ncbi:carbohydrate ABC transporter permease [Gracilibacillus kekensis]|uniref:Carbohydrate ABC transporter membrane protein 1, CUT1 family n=1 Tax=Gracilibacillus kekensis TaxID=1027249 RepID=A0A1M7LEN8_9BACI|nr:sugar ABC transporter permease [Gracilibacillus kekensis]SHM76593.1 carbohydrate ABC transporter membrane protein 1, CUT1 family [Gracilibacillus kekensis]